MHLLFQPGEEDGYGARAVLADPDFDIQPDFVFALHNLPGYPLHQVVCHEGIFTPAAKSVIFTLKGKTSHAAEPELGLNPDLAVSEILQLRKELSQPDSERDDFRLITTVHLTLGEKSYGVSAGYAEVHLTLRSWENGVMDDLQKELITKTKAICNQYKIKLEEEWLEEFSSNKNDHQSFEIIKEAAAAENLHFLDKNSGFKWGEDFGLFTDQFSGAMFGLGAGKDHPALHNPDYDFPDELIESGQRMFTSIVKQLIQCTHTSHIELSKSALQNNLDYLNNVMGDRCKVSLVVKGNAYGHGISGYVPLAMELGARHFSTFDAQEAWKVFEVADRQASILILGMIDNEELAWAIENDIEFYVFEADRLTQAIATAKKMGKKARVHVEFETGMNRTGFEEERWNWLRQTLLMEGSHLEIKGFCTHYAGAENFANFIRIRKQYKNFISAVKLMRQSRAKCRGAAHSIQCCGHQAAPHWYGYGAHWHLAIRLLAQYRNLCHYDTSGARPPEG
ncbi:MAG: M20/M25/M40 family metallo-hydrolase [Owenweeksia sp.]|nr:M20/M25/M40 family metallo-hydrolase [Owenweeksia sp.]